MRKLLILLGFVSLFIACEDVVEVDLEEAQPRLVVDAILQWEKGTTGKNQTIKLSRTRGFFEEEPRPVSGARVVVSNNSNVEFNFEEISPGEYVTSSFEPELNEFYSLRIELNGDVYSAEETLKPVVPIDLIEQIDQGGFSGEDIELKAFYTDPEGEENYYLFKFFAPFLAFPDLSVFDDEFNDGNQIFGLFSEEDLEPGMDVSIQLHGISKEYYNFLEILLAQAGSAGGPFETQPATVRGNIKNGKDADELIFGYFGLSEVDKFIYTVQ
ncbi:DUF4249 domain-containing protein [Psychroflexus sp. CAK57W]|uniref:DUF4249 domain-containing protein n=1 Tax=Psychroflexus curvus TaxID=2873595 RepID=UPI001CC930B6|nr:DUF4249 domain-containing protein [Psychroflexus curvus]MBZ9787456.1 DUF4249 domain-containing protein [Psychroflexus curvus]